MQAASQRRAKGDPPYLVEHSIKSRQKPTCPKRLKVLLKNPFSTLSTPNINIMLAQQRHDEILARINSRGTVRTMDLAEELQVTDETIRRDLQALSERNLVKRIHGGAMRNRKHEPLLAYDERETQNPEAKTRIAETAIPLIEAHDCIAFDSSTTVARVVQRLPEIPLRVVTNSQSVINTLANRSNIELVAFGGRYSRQTRTFSDPSLFRIMRHYNINKAFLSCSGLDLHTGASEAFEDQARFKEALLATTEQTIVLADHSKIGKRDGFFFAEINNITTLVTDEQAPGAFLDRLRQSGIEVRVASPS